MTLGRPPVSHFPRARCIAAKFDDLIRIVRPLSFASKEYSFEYGQLHCNRDEFNVS